jgi:hypothetical protein
MRRSKGYLGLLVFGIALWAIGCEPKTQQNAVPISTGTKPSFVTFTPSPMGGDYASNTPDPNAVASATITDTPPPGAASAGATPTAAANTQLVEVTVRAPKSYYVRSIANGRSCPDTTCDKIGQFQVGETITVDGITTGGDFKGSNLWYRTTFNGQTVYVHTSLVVEAELVGNAQPTAAPLVSVPAQPYVNPLINVCNGKDDLNCSDFASGGADAHLAACGNDEDHLDRDGDKDACEPGFN